MNLKEEAAALAASYDRDRFIAFRTALIARGIHDPLLMRLDSHTVNRLDSSAMIEHLRLLADSLPE